MKLTRLIGAKDLQALGIRFSRQYLLVLEKRCEFPQRVRLGPNSVAWRLDEVQAWIDERSGARTGRPSRWAAGAPMELEAE
jgi:predicted DNA-binding transcriptional regulator AlpA